MAVTNRSTLPIEVVEHIQSYMNFKDAAKSAAVCKHLQSSWLKLKKLDLDESLFHDSFVFWTVAMETLERYVDSNQSLDTIILRIFSGVGSDDYVDELFEQAATLGVYEVELHIHNGEHEYAVPNAVFESHNLRKFTAVGGVLEVYYELPIASHSLKSIVLLPDMYTGYRGDLISQFLGNCPNIEELTCTGEMLGIDYDLAEFEFMNLSSLIVEQVYPGDIKFIHKFLEFAPQLRRLRVRHLYDDCNFTLINDSIESLIIEDHYKGVRASITAPRLRHFKFVGVPRTSYIELVSPSHELVYELDLICAIPNSEWFRACRNMLDGLPGDRVNVTIRVIYDTPYFESTYADDRNPVEVHRMILKTCGITPKMVECLFRVCTPSYFSYQMMQS